MLVPGRPGDHRDPVDAARPELRGRQPGQRLAPVGVGLEHVHDLRHLEDLLRGEGPQAAEVLAAEPGRHVRPHPLHLRHRAPDVGRVSGDTLAHAAGEHVHHALAALHDGPVEQALGTRRGQVPADAQRAPRDAEHRHVRRIPSERGGVAANPAQGRLLVLQAVRARSPEPRIPEAAEHPEPVVDRDDHHVPPGGDPAHIAEVAGAQRSVAVDPHHHRPVPSGGARCRHVEEQAVLIGAGHLRVVASHLRAHAARPRGLPDPGPGPHRRRRVPPQLPHRRSRIGNPLEDPVLAGHRSPYGPRVRPDHVLVGPFRRPSRRHVRARRQQDHRRHRGTHHLFSHVLHAVRGRIAPADPSIPNAPGQMSSPDDLFRPPPSSDGLDRPLPARRRNRQGPLPWRCGPAGRDDGDPHSMGAGTTSVVRLGCQASAHFCKDGL
jgi:hypothetical protein